jgi:chlorite dismutase
METTPPGHYVLYTLFRAMPAYLQLSKEEKARAIGDYLARVEEFRSPLTVRTYSTQGLRRDADFLLWLIARELDPIQALLEGLRRTALAPYLENTYTFLAVTRESMYVKDHREEPHVEVIAPGKAKYLFIYPFVKTREWYLLSMEERKKMIPPDPDQHVLLVRPRRPGLRRVVRGRRPEGVRDAGDAAPRERGESLHPARHADLHVRAPAARGDPLGPRVD